MCVGENCAPQAAYYMNAQLAALYENAVACLKHHPDADRPETQFQYANALAQFSLPAGGIVGESKADLFRASFGTPRLEFVCNHDVILHLKINDAKYYLDHIQAVDLSYADLVADRVQSLSNLSVSFRVPYSKSGIKGQETSIGVGRQNHIQLVVLDLQNAQLIHTSYEVLGKDALQFYLVKYLALLRNAGNHVFFSLPDFDNAEHQLTINYSLSGNTLHSLAEVHGVSIHKINHYLSSTWLTAAVLAAGYTHTTDRRGTCLAEYRNSHFNIKLAAPRIRPLCAREVVLFFKIDEVEFIKSATHVNTHTYTNWEIALLVDVAYETEFDGQVTRLKLNLPTARFHNEFSIVNEFDETDETALAHWHTLVNFFSTEYLEILETAGYHTVYHNDSRWGRPTLTGTTPSVGVWGSDTSVTTTTTSGKKTEKETWSELVTHTDMSSFDFVTAISHTSLHAHFTNLWWRAQSSVTSTEFKNDYSRYLAKWSFEKSFTATFKAPTVTLLSDNRAIVWIHIDDGSIRLLNDRDDGKQHNLTKWSLAFEVNIKEVSHANIEALRVTRKWLSAYEESQPFKHHGHHTDRVLRHIVLDFADAEFLPEYSKFSNDLFEPGSGRPTDKVEAIVHYITTRYFVKLVEAGLHIIHTVPVWTTKSSAPWYAATDIAYHVYSQVNVTRSNWARHLSTPTEPVLVILGVTGERSLPSPRLGYSTNWVTRINKSLSYGTVAISRRAFLGDRLLDVLARINGVTTLIPLFPASRSGFKNLEFTTWADHPDRKGSLATWELVPENNASFTKYKWEHLEGWNYQHRDSSEIADGSYSALCTTRNYVELPKSFRYNALEVRIRGEVELELSFETGPQKSSTKSLAHWDAILAVSTGSDGLKVTIVGSAVPAYGETQITGYYTGVAAADPNALLRKHLSDKFSLNEVAKEFRPFEGIWHGGYSGLHAYTLASPVFNARGDLLFSLRHREQQQSNLLSATNGGRRVPSGNGPWSRSPRTPPISRSASRSVKDSPSNAQKPLMLDAVSLGNGHPNGNGHGPVMMTLQNEPAIDVSISSSAANDVFAA